jgi:hypothetical protein
MIINLTPHAVNIGSQTFQPSGKAARVAVTLATVGTIDGITLKRGTYGQVTDLPDAQDGTVYIVSALVRTALPDRKDLASPAELLRDEKGNITGCRSLEIN